MKAIVEIMESDLKPLYFINVNIPRRNSDEGPDFHVFYSDTHLSIQIPVQGKPVVKVIGEPGFSLDKQLFGEDNLEDFMASIESEGEQTS